MTETLKWPYTLLLTLYCVGIFILSHHSSPPIPKTTLFAFTGADKIAHAILYAGLAGCLSIGLRRSNDHVRPWVQCFIPIIFAILYGLSDEIHQLFIPKREFDWWDICADGLGASAAQLFLYQWIWKPIRVENK